MCGSSASGAYGSGETKLTLNLTELNALAADPAALADRLSLLLLCVSLSESLRGDDAENDRSAMGAPGRRRQLGQARRRDVVARCCELRAHAELARRM